MQPSQGLARQGSEAHLTSQDGVPNSSLLVGYVLVDLGTLKGILSGELFFPAGLQEVLIAGYKDQRSDSCGQQVLVGYEGSGSLFWRGDGGASLRC